MLNVQNNLDRNDFIVLNHKGGSNKKPTNKLEYINPFELNMEDRDENFQQITRVQNKRISKVGEKVTPNKGSGMKPRGRPMEL